MSGQVERKGVALAPGIARGFAFVIGRHAAAPGHRPKATAACAEIGRFHEALLRSEASLSRLRGSISATLADAAGAILLPVVGGAEEVRAVRALLAEVTLCGEAAGDPFYTGLFVGHGVRRFSASSRRLGELRHEVRRLDSRRSRSMARRLVRCSTRYEIRSLLESSRTP